MSKFLNIINTYKCLLFGHSVQIFACFPLVGRQYENTGHIIIFWWLLLFGKITNNMAALNKKMLRENQKKKWKLTYFFYFKAKNRSKLYPQKHNPNQTHQKNTRIPILLYIFLTLKISTKSRPNPSVKLDPGLTKTPRSGYATTDKKNPNTLLSHSQST